MRAGHLILLVALTALIIQPLCFTTAEARSFTGSEHAERDFILSRSVPGQLSYQGYLADAADSSAITANLEMTFRLFDSETKGVELWSETHPAVAVQGGLFQVLLGSVYPFPEGLFDAPELWLQTEVGAEVLAPRKPVASVAYSHKAGHAEHSSNADHAISSDWAVDADHAVFADTAAFCPAAGVWTSSGDDIYRLAGKVGIGTASPLTELDVDGSVNAVTYYGDGSNLTGITGAGDTDWTVSGNDIYSGVPGNVGIGTSSPATKLDVGGTVNTDSVYQIDGQTVLSTQGDEVISIGPGAGSNNTGGYSIFVGDSAGYKNQQHGNIFVGSKSGYENTAGFENTFVGERTGQENTDGDHNTFIGNAAGHYNTGGNNNTFVGDAAGYVSDTGNNNVCVGSGAGFYTDTGSNNVFVGTQAGLSNSSGSGNVFLGNYAGYAEQVSNKLIIANAADSSHVLIYGDFSSGNVGLGTMAPTAKLEVQGAQDGLVLIKIDQRGTRQYTGLRLDRDDDEKWLVGMSAFNDHLIFRRTASSNDMTIDTTGNVGIGTGTPGYKLDVAGDINTSGEIRRNGSSYNHPDYVFERDYELASFTDLRAYVAENKHLPGMPSAEQVSEDGVMLFEHNRLLLEKLEEAYLYILALEERMTELENSSK
jgi:hypothetical protein